MNKKTLIVSIVLAVVMASLAIIGNQYCDWAIYLMPLTFVPIIIWSIRNLKIFSIKSKKSIILNNKIKV